jgi:hypothetical protein
MYVYRVSPIVSFLPFLELTYFSSSLFELGDIVEVSFGARKLEAIIIKIENIEEVKVNIRQANFKTQKIISKIKIANINRGNLIKIIDFCERNYIAVGEYMHYLFVDNMLSKELLNLEKINFFNNLKFTNLANFTKNKIQISEIRFEDKIEIYKSKIQEAIDKKINIIIVFADDISLLSFKVSLQNSSNKIDIKKYKNTKYPCGVHLVKSKEAIKLVQDLAINNIQIDSLYIDSASFEKNVLIARPHINQLAAMYFTLEHYGESINNIEIFADKFYAPEITFFEQNNLIISHNKENKKANIKSEVKKYFVNKIISESESLEVKREDKKQIVSDEIVEIIKQKLEEKKQVFIFVLNHGYTLRLYCSDCNAPHLCKSCGRPNSLSIEANGNSLYCKDCKLKTKLRENELLLCKKCGGFNFDTFGFGIAQVYDYLKEIVDADLLYLDESQKKISDTKMVNSIIDQENNLSADSLGSVVIGSLRTLSAFTSEIDTSIIINLGNINSDNLGSLAMNVKNLKQIENKSAQMYIQRTLSDSEEKNLEKDKHNFWYKYKAGEIYKSIENEDIYKIITLTTNFTNKKYLIKLSEAFPDFIKSGEYVKNKQLVNIFTINKLEKNKEIVIKSEKDIQNQIREFVAFARNFADVYVGDSVKEFSFIKNR